VFSDVVFASATDSEVAAEVVEGFAVSAFVVDVAGGLSDDLLKKGLKVCKAGAGVVASGSVVVFSGCSVVCEFTLAAIEAGCAEVFCESSREVFVEF
jgi:hypothetical protein